MGSRLFLSTQHALEVPLTNQYAGFPYTSDCIAQYILCLVIIYLCSLRFVTNKGLAMCLIQICHFQYFAFKTSEFFG